jgi:hypothetical protein
MIATADRQVMIRFGAVDDTRGAFTSVADRLRELRSMTGQRGDIGIIGSTLFGAGAVGGVGFIGSSLANAAEKAVEIKNALNDGSLSIQQAAEKLAGTVPLLGGFWKFGRSLREFFTGEDAAQARVEFVDKLWDDFREKGQKALEDFRKTAEERRGSAVQNLNEAYAGQLVPNASELEKVLLEFAKKRDEINKKYDDLYGPIPAENKQELLDAQNQELELLRREYHIRYDNLKLTQDQKTAQEAATKAAKEAAETAEKEKQHLSEVEQYMRRRRDAVEEIANRELKREADQEKSTFHPTGRTAFEAAGLSRGIAEAASRGAAVIDVPIKQLTEAQKQTKSLDSIEKMMRDRHNAQNIVDF